MKIEFEKRDLLDLVKVLEHYRTFDRVIESVCLEDLVFKFEDALLEWTDEEQEDEDEEGECACCSCCDDDNSDDDDGEEEDEEDFDFDDTIAESTLMGLPACNVHEFYGDRSKLTFEQRDGELFVITKEKGDDLEDVYGPVRCIRRTGKELWLVDTDGNEESFEVKKFPPAWLEKLTVGMTYKVGT